MTVQGIYTANIFENYGKFVKIPFHVHKPKQYRDTQNKNAGLDDHITDPCCTSHSLMSQRKCIAQNGFWSSWGVIKWKHFPWHRPFVRGIRRSPLNSPHRGQWREAMMLYFIWAWINGWSNTREASDLRRHSSHYDVTVMDIKLVQKTAEDSTEEVPKFNETTTEIKWRFN